MDYKTGKNCCDNVIDLLSKKNPQPTKKNQANKTPNKNTKSFLNKL